jgi:sarcosine oxidase, subunit beta
VLDTADVVVVGGGCAGTSIAWQLARRGAGRVILLEKRGIAAGATGWSSAIVRQHYTHEALARMALRALGIFERFGEVVGGDAGFRRVGFLALVGPGDAAALAENVAMHRRVGIDAQVLTPEQLCELVPRLTGEGVGAAAWEPRAGYADPAGATAGYVEAGRRLGVEHRVGVTVTGFGVGPRGVERVETSDGPIETRAVVVAAGFRTRELLAPLGFDVPLTPVRHAITIVQRTPDFGPTHPTISDRVFGSYYRPEGADLTLIGTTAPYDGRVDTAVEVDRTTDDEETATLIGRFCRRFPTETAGVLRRGYTGVYDCSPDLQPMLGPVPGVDGLHIACGFSGHGFKLSPVVGELVAEKVVDGRTTLGDIDLFSPARFFEDRPITSPHPYTVATLG